MGAISPDKARELRETLGLPRIEAIPLPASVVDFANDCCVTLDEAAAGTAQMVTRPWPREWEYLADVLNALDAEKWLRVDKSGQVLVSWACIVYYLKQVLTHRGYRVGYYCQTMSKAAQHIESRFWRLYQNIPARYAKPHVELNGGILTVYHDGPTQPATAWIHPMAAEQAVLDAAADKMRSLTWTAALIDEGAFMRNLEELVSSLQPRTQRLTIASTMNGQEHFHRLGFGDVKNERAQPSTSGEVTDDGHWR